MTYIHRPCEINNTLSASDATLYVDGLIGKIPIKFLLDSGAAMSVLCYEFIANHQPQITDSTTVAVGANGTPLDVIGYTTLTMSLGPFTTQQRFTIVRQLTVDCLLGADFLHNHDAVIDYSIRTLTVGKEKRSSIPLTLGKQPHKQEDSISEDIFVRCPTDLDIPGRTIQLIHGKIDPPHNNVTCFFIESLEKLPAQFCVARSISPLVGDNEIIIQVMNVSPTPLTLYKGMKLATATPEKNVLLITQDSSQTYHSHPPLESVNLSHLTASEQEEILQLLTKFADLFSSDEGPIGQTSVVKHSIPTTGGPIRQPLCRVPEALKSTVANEVHRMLEHNIVCPSTSHGLLP